MGTASSAASPSSSGSGSSSALYRTIDGVEYDRALLDRATNLAKAGGGTLAGDAAQELVSGYITGIEASQDRAARRGRRPRVYFEEWDDPMISAIEWVSELIGIAGGDDIFADRSRGKLAKERFVQPEEVIAGAPEVMLASWCGKPFERDAVLARDGWKEIPALQADAVYELSSAEILQPGPACLTAGLAAIEKALDDAFRRTAD